MIYIVRHGETAWNAEGKMQGSIDIPLNEKGKAQARALAEKIIAQGLSFSHIYTSKLMRAAEAAQIVGEYVSAPISVLYGIEEVSFGVFEGVPFPNIVIQYPTEYQAWQDNRRYVAPPCGETQQQAMERSVAAVLSIAESSADKNVLIVSHGGIIAGFVCLKNDIPFSDFVASIPQNADILEFSLDDLYSIHSKL